MLICWWDFTFLEPIKLILNLYLFNSKPPCPNPSSWLLFLHPPKKIKITTFCCYGCFNITLPEIAKKLIAEKINIRSRYNSIYTSRDELWVGSTNYEWCFEQFWPITGKKTDQVFIPFQDIRNRYNLTASVCLLEVEVSQ